MFNFFAQSSTRTRASFELAGKHLGADVINLSGHGTKGKKGEAMVDTARTIDAYHANVVVMRTAESGYPAQIASAIGAPVLNAGDGWNEHPTQALLELIVLKNIFGEKKLTYLFVGDEKFNRVFGSCARLWKKMNWNVRVAAFPGLRTVHLAESFGVDVYDHFNEDAAGGVDVIHVLRLRQEFAVEGMIPTLREYSKNFMLNATRLGYAKKTAVFGHAGPVVRDFDIASPLLESPRCIIQPMVETGLALRAALLWLLTYHAPKKKSPWKKT